jgi:hypothetical protein
MQRDVGQRGSFCSSCRMRRLAPTHEGNSMIRTDSTICPGCGETVDPGSKLCKHCASNRAKLYKSVDAALRRHTNTYIILALSFGLLVIIGYLAWYKSSPANSTPTHSRFDLTPERVSALADVQMVKDVEANMPKWVLFFGKFGTYEDMRRAKVLDCTVTMFGKYLDCKPGPNGNLFKLNGSNLALSIGRKTPSVTGISQVDQNSALADVILTFEPSKGYRVFKRWEQAFYKPQTQDEQHTVHLRLYDDGWRIEKIE